MLNHIFKATPLIFLFIWVGTGVFAQNRTDTNEEDYSSDSLVSEAGRVRAFYPLPIISASPETSLRLGAVGVFLFRKEGQHPNTQLSSLRVPISYTLNKQFKAQVDFSYYSNYNMNILYGQLQWFNFPLLFWGVGSETPNSNEEIYTTQTANVDLYYLRRLKGNFFGGFVYKLLNSRITQKEEGGLLAQPGTIVGSDGGFTSGLGIRFRYDTRDNNMSAAKGVYLDAHVSTYQPWLGSDFSYTQLRFDGRKFFRPFKKHVLALQLEVVDTWGDPSFENMALLGGKMIMRGHYEGRYRDNTYYAAQVEYRLPLWRQNWIDNSKSLNFFERLGLVGFFGVGDVANSFGAFRLSEIKFSGGFGLRYLALPDERINIRLDFGFGTQTPGVYFQIREAF